MKSVDPVGAPAADHEVIAVTAHDDVVARIGEQGVVAALAEQLVVARAAVDDVRAGPAADDVVAAQRVDLLRAASRDDHVVAGVPFTVTAPDADTTVALRPAQRRECGPPYSSSCGPLAPTGSASPGPGGLTGRDWAELTVASATGTTATPNTSQTRRMRSPPRAVDETAA